MKVGAEPGITRAVQSKVKVRGFYIFLLGHNNLTHALKGQSQSIGLCL